MKNLAALLLLLAVACPTTAQTYANPIIAGDWSDPGVIRVGDDCYSYRSTFGWQPGIRRLPNRNGNVWTGATFGVFAVREGAPAARNADFDFVRVTTADGPESKPQAAAKGR